MMTPAQWVIVGLVAALFVPLAAAVAISTALALRRALLAEIAAVDAGQYTAETGYERFVERSARIRRSMHNGATAVSVVAYLFSFWIPLILVFIAPGLVLRFAPFPGIPFFPTGFVMTALLLTITLSLYDLLSGLMVEPRAGIRLGGPAFTRAVAFRRFFSRLLFIYLPPLVVVEAVGLFVRVPAIPFTSPGVDLVILALGAAVFFVRQLLLRWPVRSAPIEQSTWVAVAPRAREWARLAEVEIEEVRVRYLTGRQVGDGAVRGWRHPSLSLSDRFLANSDWRQQDALVAQLLGMARQRRSRPLAGIIQPAIEALCIAFIVGTGLALVPLSGLLIQNTPLFLAVLVSMLILGPAALVYFIYSILRRHVFGRTTWRKQTLAADRFAVELTGDPLALGIALHTLAQLNAAPRWLRAANDALMADRIAALNVLLDRPGPSAPWARQPVPAIVALASGPQALTAPLDQAPLPAPVPVVPWGVAPAGEGGEHER
jgi:hypothetical protein